MKYAGMFGEAIRSKEPRVDFQQPRIPFKDVNDYRPTTKSILVNKPNPGHIYANEDKASLYEKYSLQNYAGRVQPEQRTFLNSQNKYTCMSQKYTAPPSEYRQSTVGFQPETYITRPSTGNRSQLYGENKYNRVYESKYKQTIDLGDKRYEPRESLTGLSSKTPKGCSANRSVPYYREIGREQPTSIADLGGYERMRHTHEFKQEQIIGQNRVESIRNRSCANNVRAQERMDLVYGYEGTSGKQLLKNLDKVQDKIRSLLKQ